MSVTFVGISPRDHLKVTKEVRVRLWLYLALIYSVVFV